MFCVLLLQLHGQSLQVFGVLVVRTAFGIVWNIDAVDEFVVEVESAPKNVSVAVTLIVCVTISTAVFVSNDSSDSVIIVWDRVNGRLDVDGSSSEYEAKVVGVGSIIDVVNDGAMPSVDPLDSVTNNLDADTPAADGVDGCTEVNV